MSRDRPGALDQGTKAVITSAMVEAGAEVLQRSCDCLIMLEDYAASVAALLAEGGLHASVAHLCDTEPPA
jgi:hypothetical protein